MIVPLNSPIQLIKCVDEVVITCNYELTHILKEGQSRREQPFPYRPYPVHGKLSGTVIAKITEKIGFNDIRKIVSSANCIVFNFTCSHTSLTEPAYFYIFEMDGLRHLFLDGKTYMEIYWGFYG